LNRTKMNVNIKSRKLTSEEIEKLRADQLALTETRAKLIQTGKWWEPWEQDSGRLASAASFGFSREDFYLALSVLKQLYPDSWLRANASTSHPMIPALLEPQGNFLNRLDLKAIHLGWSVGQFGLSRLSTQMMSELRHAEQFEGFAFEIEVLSWLKTMFPDLLLEHELGLGKDVAKPDAMLRQGLYAEIRSLQTSQKDKAVREQLSSLGSAIERLVDQGTWNCSVDLGKPRDLELGELERSIENAKAIVSRANPPFDDTQGNVHIKMAQADGDPLGFKIVSTVSQGLSSPEPQDLIRILRHLVDTQRQRNEPEGIVRKLDALPRGSSLMVFVRGSVPLIDLMLIASGASGEAAKNRFGEQFFGFAIGQDEKAKAIKQIYVEIWSAIRFGDSNFQRTYKETPFLFLPIENPYFEPL